MNFLILSGYELPILPFKNTGKIFTVRTILGKNQRVSKVTNKGVMGGEDGVSWAVIRNS